MCFPEIHLNIHTLPYNVQTPELEYDVLYESVSQCWDVNRKHASMATILCALSRRPNLNFLAFLDESRLQKLGHSSF